MRFKQPHRGQNRRAEGKSIDFGQICKRILDSVAYCPAENPGERHFSPKQAAGRPEYSRLSPYFVGLKRLHNHQNHRDNH